MNRLFSFLLAAGLFSGAAFAMADTTPADAVAQRMTALSIKQEIAANDARVAQSRALLDKAVKLTREEPVAIEAACSRYVGHLHDSAQIEATPLELLEALTRFGKAGQPMNETLQGYAAARKAAPARSHAEAMAALGGKK